MDFRNKQIWVGRLPTNSTGNPLIGLLYFALFLVVALPLLLLIFSSIVLLSFYALLRSFFPRRHTGAVTSPDGAPPGEGQIIDVEVTKSK